MSDSNQINKGKGIGEHIKQVGAYGIIITAFGIGLAIASAYWSSSVSVLNSQLTITREEANRATQELMQVKTEYLSYRTLTQPSSKFVSDSIKLPPTSSPSVTEKSTNNVEEKYISAENSYSFFGGDVIISLIALAFEGDPLRHRVLANVSSPNGQVVKIDRQDIGTTLTYKAKSTYKITILYAGTFSASFRVVKLDK
jgi:hypothetical protein